MRFLTLKLAAGAPGYGIFIPRRDHFISAPLPELLIKSRGTFWVGVGGGGGGGFCVLLGIRSYIPGPVSRWSTAGPTVCGPEGTTASLPD